MNKFNPQDSVEAELANSLGIAFEDTRKNILSKLVKDLVSKGVREEDIEIKEEGLIIKTSSGNFFIPPVKKLLETKRKDTKKLRFKGNGVIRNGFIYDEKGNKLGEAYLGEPTTLNRYSYELNKEAYLRNTPISLEKVISLYKAKS